VVEKEMLEFAYFFLGVLSGVVCSFFFYQRSGQELRREAEKLRDKSEELRKLANLALVVITDPKGKYEPIFDAAGMITGLKVQLEARSLVAGRAPIGTPTLSTAQQPPSQNGE
jgi:hypothetical protein